MRGARAALAGLLMMTFSGDMAAPLSAAPPERPAAGQEQATLSVGISGPSTIHYAGGYDWTASATGGSGNYTYRWWIDWGGSQAYPHGEWQTASLYVSEYDPTYFILTVEVTSGTQTATNSIGVCNFIASAAC